MFSPLVLICSLAGDCHTPLAPVFPTREHCEQATQEYIENIKDALPPNIAVVRWTCIDWGKDA